MSSNNAERQYRTKEGTDKNGHKYTRKVRNPDQKGATIAATNSAGMIRPSAPTPPGVTATGRPQVIRGDDGSTIHYNGAGRKHRDGGEPAVTLANGQVEHWVDGVQLSRSMPGLKYPNVTTCEIAQIYVKQPSGGFKPMTVASSTTGAVVPPNGSAPARFAYRGVELESMQDVENAKAYPVNEFDEKFGDSRVEFAPLHERFGDDDDSDASPRLFHKAKVRGAGLDADGYNRHGYDMGGFTREGIDSRGRDREGFHAESGFDNDGFNREGFNADGIDREGFNKNGDLVGAPVPPKREFRQTGVGATDGSYVPKPRSTPPASAPQP